MSDDVGDGDTDGGLLLFDVPISISVQRCTLHRTSRIPHRIEEGWLLAGGFWTLLVLFFTGHKISHPDGEWYCTVVQEVLLVSVCLYCTVDCTVGRL